MRFLFSDATVLKLEQEEGSKERILPALGVQETKEMGDFCYGFRDP